MPTLVCWFMFLIAVATAASQPCTEDHIPGGYPPFGCRPYRIDEASGRQVIAPCADTIRLCVGKPLPIPHPDAPVSSPVRLYRMGPDPTSPTVVEEVGVHWSTEANNGAVVVIPDPPMEALEADQRTPVRYRLVTDCRFWEGPQAIKPDTSFFEIWKQHAVPYSGEARRIHDQQAIDAEVVMNPMPLVAMAFIADGVYLTAESGERYRFDHWTCSAEGIVLQSTAAEQLVRDVCWPLQDTVVFTAWYQDRTADLPSEPDKGIRLRATRENLLLTDPRPTPFTDIVITDVHGRTVFTSTNLGGAHELRAPWSVPPGWYAATIRTASTVQVYPIIVSP